MYYFIGAIGAVGLLGLLFPLIAGGKLGKLNRAAKHPSKSEHPLVKTMVTKFTACYKLKIGVNNVDIFVDKYVNTYKICGLYLSTWDKLCGQPAVILLLAGIADGVYHGILRGGQAAELSTMWISFAAAAVLIVYNRFFDRKGKMRAFASEMKDYLENSLKIKLEQEFVYPEPVREPARASQQALKSGTLRKSRTASGRGLRTANTVLAEEEAAAGHSERRTAGQKEGGGVAADGELTAAEAGQHPALCMEQEIIDEILREYLS